MSRSSNAVSLHHIHHLSLLHIMMKIFVVVAIVSFVFVTTYVTIFTNVKSIQLKEFPLPNFIKSKMITLRASSFTCHQGEVYNFVYLKTHKTASETLSAIFRRFGYVRNLSFVLPIGRRNNLGWPYRLHPGMYRPTKTGVYNILCEHAVLHFPTFRTVMPNDTRFITSLREPFSHFLSAFYYFNVSTYLNLSQQVNPIETFFRNPDYYDNVYKTLRYRGPICVPPLLSVLRNSMSFDLGFQVGFPPDTPDWTYDSTASKKWLRILDRNMHLVLLTEYLDESLVLLRRKMCWSAKDIIYVTRNPTTWSYLASRNGSVVKSDAGIDQAIVQRFRQWSAADVALYEHFSKKFWKQISLEGDSFWSEVRAFKDVRLQVLQFCAAEKSRTTTKLFKYEFDEGKNNISFVVNRADCRLFESRLMPELKAHYDQLRVDVKPNFPHATGPNC